MKQLDIIENHVVVGQLPGLRQQASVAVLRVNHAWLRTLAIAALADSLRVHLPALAVRYEQAPDAPALGRFMRDVVVASMKAADMNLLEDCQLVHHDEGDSSSLRLMVPVPNVQYSGPRQIVEWLAGVLNRLNPVLLARDVETLHAFVQGFRVRGTQADLVHRLLAAAHSRDIPWLHFADAIYQFGWGAKGRLLDGTFTERTPAIAARLTRNKAATAYVLLQAGLPVPRHRIVANAIEAVAEAQRLGWPVVVKPLDLDGGRGVTANLSTNAAVERAYERARALSERILVEKHIAGKDFRVIVFNGKVLGVWERRPGAVVGNGRDNVHELLCVLNAEPARQPEARRRKQIVVDEEATELLVEQGLDLEAIPAPGRVVRLRRTNNIAAGGSAEKLEIGSVHPDNLLLCERAARVLRLDVAGVDLLMPDIGRSWFEGGAAICEVNAQPQLASEFPQVLMQSLFPGNGRIPVALIIDDGDSDAWVGAVLAALDAAGLHAGCALGTDVFSGNHVVVRNTPNIAQAAHTLLRDPQVQVVLMCLHNRAQLQHGFPVDRCDLLVLAGGAGFGGEHEAIARALDAGKPQVLVDADSDLWQQWPANEARVQRVASTELAGKVMALLLDLAARS